MEEGRRGVGGGEDDGEEEEDEEMEEINKILTFVFKLIIVFQCMSYIVPSTICHAIRKVYNVRHTM